ncbi:hypothetical protein [Flavobacterium sp. N1736]|uniref:hypothetical protein n=1 Tax=Flavobacterium sp. N1736 TaxID=2986823 RepID=UPI00222407AE|nr:hypothetical protein [Flavobacterium sp. N1736]
MKKILVFLTMITFFSCDNAGEKDILGLTDDTGAEFSVFNDQNEDLLNPENPNHLDISKIRLFYVIDGVSHEFQNLNVDDSSVLRIVKHENEYRIRILLNDFDKSEKTVMYIQWSETDRDMIESSFKRAYNLYKPGKIWFNKKLVWEFTFGIDQAYFKVIK